MLKKDFPGLVNGHLALTRIKQLGQPKQSHIQYISITIFRKRLGPSLSRKEIVISEKILRNVIGCFRKFRRN